MTGGGKIVMDVSFWVGVLAVVALFGVYMSETWTNEQPDARITATITTLLVLCIITFLLAKTQVKAHKP